MLFLSQGHSGLNTDRGDLFHRELLNLEAGLILRDIHSHRVTIVNLTGEQGPGQTVINLFLQSDAIAFAVSVLGVLIFAGLTAYDTQNIKNTYLQMASANDQEWMGKAAIMGALNLYLDFLNMFMFLLQFLGQNRN